MRDSLRQSTVTIPNPITNTLLPDSDPIPTADPEHATQSNPTHDVFEFSSEEQSHEPVALVASRYAVVEFCRQHALLPRFWNTQRVQWAGVTSDTPLLHFCYTVCFLAGWILCFFSLMVGACETVFYNCTILMFLYRYFHLNSGSLPRAAGSSGLPPSALLPLC